MMKKILIVDNNKVMIRLLSNHLEQSGYEVATAGNGLEALDRLDTFKPDVMFVDLIMPRINGEKLCRIIRSKPRYDSLALVVISAIAAEEKLDFISFGATACVAKGPFQNMKEDIAAVLDLLEKNDTAALSKKIFGMETIYERDITRELLATKHHFEITLNNMDEGFLELTSAGKIIFANKMAIELLGLKEEMLLSASLPDFFKPEERRRIGELLERDGFTIAEIGEEEPVTLHGNYLLVKIVPFLDAGQKCFIVLIHNITTRKEAEFELLQHRDRLAAVIRERTADLEELNAELEEALSKVKILSGLLPICSYCKRIRDDKGYWSQIEAFIREHSDADFSHSICPDCARKHFPDLDIFHDDE